MEPELGALSDGEAAAPAAVPIAGWGRRPVRPGRLVVREQLALPGGGGAVLPRGLGRAYGDAALPASPDTLVLGTARADRVLAWDERSARLTCEAGCSLDGLLRAFLPRGWFPPVTPGTRFVTVGGMVAADVHGKNHHRAGSFGRFVERLVLDVADGRRVACGPDVERELFLATVGGLGLTGLIREVTFRLAPVESPWLVEETAPVADLDAMLAGLRDSAAAWPYTVGWLDGLARGRALGRGILMRARHATRAEAGDRAQRPHAGPRVPVDAPGWLLCAPAIRAFNALYRARYGRSPRRRLTSPDAFFYPLDAVRDWNRLYGRAGFLQYQCVIPRAAGPAPVARVLETVAASGAPSFLTVIKDFGPAFDAYLSFPVEGTTLALDLPYRGGGTELLVHGLNRVVLEAAGRVYLAKDAVTRPEDFARMMPRLAEWQAVRDRWDPGRRFRSALSVRLFGDPP